MQISLKCEKCSHIYLGDSEKSSCLEIDFLTKQIKYLCRYEECGHENIIDFANWKKTQERSSLPRMSIMR